MSGEPIILNDPLVVMFEQGDSVICHIHPSNHSYEHYGMFICDLVRHVAGAFDVDEDAVWEWVDKERHHHTTDIERAS